MTRERGGDNVMKMTPSILLNIMLLTIISASFFLVNTTANTSNYETTSVEYNPWRDLNDDGIINIYDVVMVTGIYGSTGTPINKTALLYNVNDTFTELLSRIDSLNASLHQSSSQIIRFHHPDEEVIPYYGTWTVAAFTWTPKNSSNNVILSAHAWAEIKCPNQTQSSKLLIRINGRLSDDYGSHSTTPSYEVSEIHCWSPGYYHFPPSESYTIEYEVIGGYPTGEPGNFPIFIRNINIVVLVADGVPASNP